MERSEWVDFPGPGVHDSGIGVQDSVEPCDGARALGLQGLGFGVRRNMGRCAWIQVSCSRIRVSGIGGREYWIRVSELGV